MPVARRRDSIEKDTRDARMSGLLSRLVTYRDKAVSRAGKGGRRGFRAGVLLASDERKRERRRKGERENDRERKREKDNDRDVSGISPFPLRRHFAA